jgi:lipopolysaccharide transport protein LptA
MAQTVLAQIAPAPGAPAVPLSPEDAEREQRRRVLAGGIDPQAKLDANAPIHISSDSFSLDAKNRVFTYSGNVEAFQADLFITAEEMVGGYDENNRLQEVVCRNDVVVTRGERLRALANRAVYYVEEQRIELTEGPEVIERNNALSADKITLFLAEDRSAAEGRVRVKLIREQGDQGITGVLDRPQTHAMPQPESPAQAEVDKNIQEGGA